MNPGELPNKGRKGVNSQTIRVAEGLDKKRSLLSADWLDKWNRYQQLEPVPSSERESNEQLKMFKWRLEGGWHQMDRSIITCGTISALQRSLENIC